MLPPELPSGWSSAVEGPEGGICGMGASVPSLKCFLLCQAHAGQGRIVSHQAPGGTFSKPAWVQGEPDAAVVAPTRANLLVETLHMALGLGSAHCTSH